MEHLDGRVLLVDDEEQFLEVLAERLTARGLKVNTATCGEDALVRLDDRGYDVIVLDLAMPGIDGIETLRMIKRKDPAAEIIMLTGHASVKNGIAAMKLGAEDFLEKPVDLNVLLEKIGEAKHKHMLLLEKKSRQEIKKILASKGW